MFNGFLVSTPLPELFDRSFLTCLDGVRGAACAAHHDPKARTSTLDRRWRLVHLADPQLTTEDAEAVVAASASRIPLLIQWRVESPSPERAARLRCLLETLFQLAAESDDSQLLPFGVVVRGHA